MSSPTLTRLPVLRSLALPRNTELGTALGALTIQLRPWLLKNKAHLHDTYKMTSKQVRALGACLLDCEPPLSAPGRIRWEFQDHCVDADDPATDEEIDARLSSELSFEFNGTDCCRHGGSYWLTIQVWEKRDGTVDSEEEAEHHH